MQFQNVKNLINITSVTNQHLLSLTIILLNIHTQRICQRIQYKLI